MKSAMTGFKKMVAITALKARREELKKLKVDYAERYKIHAEKFGKDPNNVPRTMWSDMVDDHVKRLDKEIHTLENPIINKTEEI